MAINLLSSGSTMINANWAYLFYSFLFVLLLGYPYIYLLKYFKSQGQPIREDGPQQHLSKKGTPTMGGVLISLSVFGIIIVLPQLLSGAALGVVVVLFGYTLIGAVDDVKKLISSNAYAGLSPNQKLFFQIVIALVGVLFVLKFQDPSQQYHMFLPLLNTHLNLWYFFVPFAVFVIVGASNAVNLTDGLDGLVSVPVVLVLAFFVLATMFNPSFFSHLSNIDIASLQIVMITLMGACLGFLFFNMYPAKVFMGDVGSLSLGGVLGILSVALKLELFLALAGAIFVIETVSVMIQIVVFRKTGKRFFKMAPIHHHFEHLGWSETSVVKLFWLGAFLSAALALILFKASV